LSDSATEPAAEITAANLEAELARRGLGGPDYGLLTHRDHIREDTEGLAFSQAHPGNPGFDWESVYAHCDGVTDAPIDEQAERNRLAMQMTGKMLKRLLDWLLAVNMQDHRALKSIGVRAVVMAWVIDPGRFDNASLTTIAKSLGYGSGHAMNPEASDFARQFGITNHFQAHDPRRKHEIATNN